METEYRQSPELSPGYRLDRYELLCPIAEGGMAQVWVARMTGKHGFSRYVAVKTILPKYSSEPMFQKMFLDEARIASAIEHTNVAQTLDLGEQHDVLFLVMEWIDGDALTKLMSAVAARSRKMPHGIILRILADTCGGLHAAHELRGPDGVLLGVIHRDVSPQNILVSTRGVAKLIDFGIAKARDRVSGDTSAGILKGKIKYMAPEQALGRPADRRVDVWAVGAILYRVLAGRPAFAAASELEMLHALTAGKPPAPLPDNVPTAIGNVAMRALCHDPAQRFATAAEMQEAMERAMVEAGVPTTTNDVQAFVAEHMADRAVARKKTFDLALEAARERDRMTQLLKPAQMDSSSGIMDVGSRVLPLGSGLGSRPPPPRKPPLPPAARRAPPVPSDDDGDVTVANMSPFVPTPAPSVPTAVVSVPTIPGAPPSVPTPIVSLPMGGIHFAPEAPGLMTAEMMLEPSTARSNERRQRLLMAVSGALVGLAVVIVVAIVARSTGGEAHAVATSSLARWSKTLSVPKVPTPPPEASATAPIASVDSPYALAAAPTPPPATAKAIAATPPAAQPAPPAPPAKPIATTTAMTAPTRKPRVDVDGF